MIVSNQVSALWLALPSFDLEGQVRRLLLTHPTACLFFRADDVAIPSTRQNRLLQLFVQYQIPLCAALVPAWLNRQRWQQIEHTINGQHQFFSWHQHGWTHRNHQRQGKKQEFGSERSHQQKQIDICRGRDKLVSLLGSSFLPVFTPPWNRLDRETLDLLEQEGFQAISRFRQDKLPSLPTLPDFAANVDLHTRKEPAAAADWAQLLWELDQALATGCAGLMLHHQRMNDHAFFFIELLLNLLHTIKTVQPVHFTSLLKNHTVASGYLP